MMKNIASVVAVVCLVMFSLPLVAQAPKPYHDGSVWEIQYIHVKGGMEDKYSRYLASDWKREQEALKKAGYVLNYMVIDTEAHSPNDFNVILMTQFKDLATLESNADKMEQLSQQLFGGMEKVEAGYVDRSSYRDLVGTRIGREIILEPKK